MGYSLLQQRRLNEHKSSQAIIVQFRDDVVGALPWPAVLSIVDGEVHVLGLDFSSIKVPGTIRTTRTPCQD